MTDGARHRSLDARVVGLAQDSFRAPQLAAWAVARDDLVKRLCASTARLVVIDAPAGYGKTTTASLWCEADGRPFAWVGLEPADDDPVTLVQHVALGLQELHPLPAPLTEALTAPGRPVDTELLPAVLHELVIRSPLVLVLDDVHLVTTPGAIGCLQGLVSWMPASSRVVLIGRSAPPLHLARYRLSDDVLELSAVDLAMDETEAGELMARAGLSLEETTLAEVVTRTEGWPGGLGLVAQILREGANRLWRGELASGAHGVIADYLVNEVLGGLHPGVVSFLERSATLERMSVPLLDELLETDESAAIFAALVSRGMPFLIPLDDRNEWFRFHHLFAELLRARLRSSDPATAMRLHQRASMLLAAGHDFDGAVRHAVAAGEIGRASDLLLCQAVPMALGGRSARLRIWLDLLDWPDVQQHPAAAIAVAWAAVAEGDHATLDRALDAAERSGHQGPLADGSPSVTVATAVLRAVMALRGVHGVIEDTEVARRGGGAATNPWWAVATLLQGTAFEMLGELDTARDLIQGALPELLGMPAYECGAQGHLAILALYDNDLVEAERRSSRALAIIRENHLESVLPLVPLMAVGALCEARAGRTDEADPRIATANLLLARFGHLSPRTALLSYVLLARAAIVLGRFAQGLIFVEEASRARRRDGSAVHLNAQVDELRGLLSQHRDTVGPGGPPLTAAELRVLAYLPTHLSMQVIAERLGISRNTAKSHTVAIYRKLGARSRGEAVDVARRTGMLVLPVSEHD